jgi:Holliday junction resolvase RusA-like endonuclease
MTNGELQFWVPGIPQPGGSKKGFYNPKLGRVILSDANEKVKPWRASVAQAAQEATQTIFEGPLRVRFQFCFTRPKGHFGKGRNANVLLKSAPPYPSVKPDATKLVRSTEDALKGILWRDDSQIVTQGASKRYADQAGAWITVRVED